MDLPGFTRQLVQRQNGIADTRDLNSDGIGFRAERSQFQL